MLLFLSQVYQQHGKDKKDRYNQRAIDIKKSSSDPLVHKTSGGLAPEYAKINTRLAEMIAKKQKEPYASVMNYVRTKLRFTLQSSTFSAIRGFQGK